MYIQNLIKEICNELNIEYNLVSKDWIMILKKEDKIRYIAGYKFGLNDHSVGQVCDDKYALYDVLKTFGIKVAEHYIVFKNYNKEDILKYSLKYNYDMVVKSNTGTCGNDMVHVNNKEDLFIYIDKLLIKNFSISISPYYNIKNEYRTIILNDKVELFYGKKRPIVIGDSEKTIYELLCEFNKNYFSKIDNSDLNVVLPNNEVFEYNWQHNLSKGAIPFYVKDEYLKERIQQLALKTSRILNLGFASVDIIELENGDIMVLEVNSGVMIDNFAHFIDNGEKIAKDIYKKAIEEMFK